MSFLMATINIMVIIIVVVVVVVIIIIIVNSKVTCRRHCQSHLGGCWSDAKLTLVLMDQDV